MVSVSIEQLRSNFQSQQLVANIDKKGRGLPCIKPQDPIYGLTTLIDILRYRRSFTQFHNQELTITDPGFALLSSLAKYADFFHVPYSEMHTNPLFALGYYAYQYMFDKEDNIIDNADFRQKVREETWTIDQFAQAVSHNPTTQQGGITSHVFFEQELPKSLEKLAASGKLTQEKAVYLSRKMKAAHDLWLKAEYEMIIHPEIGIDAAIQRIFDTTIAQAEILGEFFIPEKYCHLLEQKEALTFLVMPPFLATMIDELMDVGQDHKLGVCSTPIGAAQEVGERQLLNRKIAHDPYFSLGTLLHYFSLPKTVKLINNIFNSANGMLDKVDHKTSGALRILAIAYSAMTQIRSLRTVLPVIRGTYINN